MPAIVCKASGPIDAKIMIIGEAPGRDEEIAGIPFVGMSGRELNRMLENAGIDPKSVYKTNVFSVKPAFENLDNFCGSKEEAHPRFPPVRPGRYIKAIYDNEIKRLDEEIKTVKPNVIVALGNVALGAVTGQMQIGKTRGTVLKSLQGPKVIATYHPAMVLRQWSYRVICVADFKKAKREAEFPEIKIPQRRILIDPTRKELQEYYDKHLANAAWIGVDIETAKGQIRCIGFSPSENSACLVPFIDKRKPDFHYWPTPGEERWALELVRKILTGPAQKVLQNGSYDFQYIWRWFGCGIKNWTADTTLAHHALYPEMQKDLGFLGSLYTVEPAWKIMRHRAKDASEKKEE